MSIEVVGRVLRCVLFAVLCGAWLSGCEAETKPDEASSVLVEYRVLEMEDEHAVVSVLVSSLQLDATVDVTATASGLELEMSRPGNTEESPLRVRMLPTKSSDGDVLLDVAIVRDDVGVGWVHVFTADAEPKATLTYLPAGDPEANDTPLPESIYVPVTDDEEASDGLLEPWLHEQELPELASDPLFLLAFVVAHDPRFLDALENAPHSHADETGTSTGGLQRHREALHLGKGCQHLVPNTLGCALCTPAHIAEALELLLREEISDGKIIELSKHEGATIFLERVLEKLAGIPLMVPACSLCIAEKWLRASSCASSMAKEKTEQDCAHYCDPFRLYQGDAYEPSLDADRHSCSCACSKDKCLDLHSSSSDTVCYSTCQGLVCARQACSAVQRCVNHQCVPSYCETTCDEDACAATNCPKGFTCSDEHACQKDEVTEPEPVDPEPVDPGLGEGGADGGGPKSVAAAASHNDPHMRTFDGLGYDLQSPGEFVLLELRDEPFGARIQARHEHLAADRCPNVTLNTAVAAVAGNARVAFYANELANVWVDGSEAPLKVGETHALGLGAALVRSASSSWQLRWSDGARLSVQRVPRLGEHHLDITVQAPEAWRQRTRGLFGTLDSVPNDDLVTREGDLLAQPLLWQDLYTEFAASYRVRADETLFDYAEGKTPESYQTTALPGGPALAAALPPALLEGAEAICDATGVTDPILRNACLLDVACSGGDATQADWVRDAEAPLASVALSYDFQFTGSHCSSLSIPSFTRIDTVTVPGDGSSVASSVPLELGTRYKLRASGASPFGGPGDGRGDAEYGDFENPPGSVIDTCTGGWDFGLGIDTPDAAPKTNRWGPYCASHAYTTDFVGAGVPVKFRYVDCFYSDNVGGLTLEIFAPQCTDADCTNLVGTRPGAAGLSCADILARGGSVGSGIYWLQGAAGALQAECEMNVDLGGWTRLTAAVASALDPNVTKTYLYLYRGRWYRSPPTKLNWSWDTGQELVGSYAYFDGVSTSSYVCSGSNEKPAFGVGCSNGPGGLPKTLPIYAKDTATGSCTICQDAPFAFSVAPCQTGVAVFVR